MASGATLTVTVADARSRLLAELADGPARRGYGIAYDLLGNRAEAEEAVQEALARACENLDDLREPGAAPGWFLRIVTTTCLRTLRRRRLRRAVFGRFFGGEERRDADEPARNLPVADDDAPLHGTTSARADHELSGRRDIAALLGNLEALPAKQRAALVLRYGHDLPVPEVASMLGVELATAKTHLVRGLARLRELMESSR
jgi:RNA polymerase sigma-70 factor (ECF subfamily)